MQPCSQPRYGLIERSKPMVGGAALAGSELVGEIVVSDGGSRDGTVAIAEAAGARVVAGPRGRGPQLIAGAAAAKGEWLLFLHADCRLALGWKQAVGEFIARPGA